MKKTPAADFEVSDDPWLREKGRAHLEAALRDVRCYLEYGSGGSTVLAGRLGVPDIVSVESDADWLGKVEAKMSAAAAPGRFYPLHVDIGPTEEYGYPVDRTPRQEFRRYPLKPWRFCRERGLRPDLVLVDGRFRRACMIATLIHAQPGTRVIFDDYRRRPHYHDVEAFAKPLAHAGRMVEFRVPKGLPLERLRQAFEAAADDLR